MGRGWLSVCAVAELALLFSGETVLVAVPVELFRTGCERFGDLAEENDAFRLKPDGALDAVELEVDSIRVAGDPLLVPGLVVTLVDVAPPNIVPPFSPVKSLRKPLLELERCMLAQCVQRFGTSQGRLSINKGLQVPRFTCWRQPRLLPANVRAFNFG
jgi:hypothetical protein